MIRALRRRGWGLTALGVIGVALYLFPIYWMFTSGLKNSAEIFASPPTIFPRAPTLAAFVYVFQREDVLRYLRNSLAIAIPVTLLTLAMGAMGGYALSRLNSRIADIALFTILLLQVFPEALLATPMFIIFKSLGLLNTFAAVILATTSKTLAFALVILRPMFRQVPIELEEASLVDGCTGLQTFRRIVLPLMRIPLIVVGALSFVQAYGEFVYPLTLLSSGRNATRNGRHLQLRRRRIRRLAPCDGILLGVRAADPAAVPRPAAPYRSRTDRRRAQMTSRIGR